MIQVQADEIATAQILRKKFYAAPAGMGGLFGSGNGGQDKSLHYSLQAGGRWHPQKDRSHVFCADLGFRTGLDPLKVGPVAHIDQQG